MTARSRTYGQDARGTDQPPTETGPTRPNGRPDTARLQPEGPIDPWAVRVTVAASSRMEGDPTTIVAPARVPVVPLRDQPAGVGLLGGAANPSIAPDGPSGAAGPSMEPTKDGSIGESEARAGLPLVDGLPALVRLEWVDETRGTLVHGEGEAAERTRLLLGPLRSRDSDGMTVREVVVGGWRIDIVIESERRAALRERARRGKEALGHSGPLEVHAIIPGRIVAVSVATGEAISAGQQLLVLEAMKMQNELRAPREGSIDRIAVAVGENVEVGDLLMVIS